MKLVFSAALLLAATALTSLAQSNDPVVFLAPVPHPEHICRLHPVMDDVGFYIPPPTDISDIQDIKSSTINVTFIDEDVADPWPQAAKDALTFAKTIWENHIDSPVALEIEARWASLGGCDLMAGVTLGAAGPTLVASWGGSPVANSYYPIGLANAILGSDNSPGTSDINSFFNKECDEVSSDLWYFGTDGAVPAGKIDFASVVLHELGHGLGFSGSATYDDGVNDTGSGGTNGNECNGAAGAGCFSAIPNIYDRFVVDAATSGISLLETGTYPDNSTILGTAFTNSATHFESSSVNANNSGDASPLFGPNPWESGSSYSHFDETTYNGTAHAMMTPYLSSQEATHSPGSLTCAVFQDIGWSMGPDCVTLLPVELVSFDAIATGTSITLTWTTAGESNNAGFSVEMRASADEFLNIGFIEGAGTTTDAKQYSFNLSVGTAGRYTFRLKQIDADGLFSYSDTVELDVALLNAYQLSSAYPNPFNPITQFNLMVATDQEVDIQVVDVTGRIVRQLHNGNLESGRQYSFTFDAGTLPSGAYWIRVVGEQFSSNKAVVLLK